MSLRKRTRQLACFLSSSSAGTTFKGNRLEDDEDTDDCCSRRLIEDNEEPAGQVYNLSRHEGGSFEEELHAVNNTTRPSQLEPPKAPAVSPATCVMTLSDTSSVSWPEYMAPSSFPDLELEQSSLSSGVSSTLTPSSSLKSASFSAPNSPHPSVYSTATPSMQSLQSAPLSPLHSIPDTPTRNSTRLPLTSPLPRRSPSWRANSESALMPPVTAFQPPPCKQVMGTLSLLKSIKQQIKALKRRESHLSTKLGVHRRERQHMQDQISQLESRRLRVEAMFFRPLPLVLLLPVAFSTDDEYDLCLVTEGQDAWNSWQPLIRIQLAQNSLRGVLSSRMGAILLHFGPTLTQPMAAATTFLRHDAMEVPLLDLQPIVKQTDYAFWERVTGGQVFEADVSKQLSEVSCQFLFDALMEHKYMWRDELSQVVDTKTRRIQWILQQEADALYYQTIPSTPSALSIASTALVELDEVSEANSCTLSE